MNWTPSEMMTIAASRALRNEDVCFVGIGLPSTACNLARLTHAPRITLIYESGTIAARPGVLPLSIGDGELCTTALTTVSVREMFRYWLQGGRITVGFLSGAQVDRYGNLNSTVIGPYGRPKVRLPGSGGAPEIATSCGEVFIIMTHNARSFVPRLDFLTSLGHGSAGRERQSLGVTTRGPTLLVTDLCLMRPDPETNEFRVVSLHPGVPRDRVRECTGWEVQFSKSVEETFPPSRDELEALRELTARTVRAHGAAGAWRQSMNRPSSPVTPVSRPSEEGGTEPELISYRRPLPGTQPDNNYPQYRSTVRRAPSRPPILLPHTLSEITGPLFGHESVSDTDSDLTRQHPGEPLGERIIVSGRLMDEDGRPVPEALIEIWQANAAGRYFHARDDHPAPLDPNFTGGGRILTGADGSYRFVTIKPGAYPWRNHSNAWRPAHIHFSMFGPAFATRLVTQMYFPGDPLLAFDPIYQSIPDERARTRLIAGFELETTKPEWALGYHFDIVLRGREATPIEA